MFFFKKIVILPFPQEGIIVKNNTTPHPFIIYKTPPATRKYSSLLANIFYSVSYYFLT